MWFDSWSDIVRVLLVGIASYAVLIASIRILGERTLAQLNAFDFVVTVASPHLLGGAGRRGGDSHYLKYD